MFKLNKLINMAIPLAVGFGLGMLVRDVQYSGRTARKIEQGRLDEQAKFEPVMAAINYVFGNRTIFVTSSNGRGTTLYSLPKRPDVFYSLDKIKQDEFARVDQEYNSTKTNAFQAYNAKRERIVQLTTMNFSNYFQDVRGGTR